MPFTLFQKSLPTLVFISLTLEYAVFRVRSIFLPFSSGHVFLRISLIQDRRQFKKKIHQYSNTLAFTSMGIDVDNQAIQGSGPSSFCIHGTLRHLMGALIPPDCYNLSPYTWYLLTYFLSPHSYPLWYVVL